MGGLGEPRGSLTVKVSEERSRVGAVNTPAGVVKMESGDPSSPGDSAPGDREVYVLGAHAIPPFKQTEARGQ